MVDIEIKTTFLIEGGFFLLFTSTEPNKFLQKTTKPCHIVHKKTPRSNEIGVFSAIS
jgi:hypothetical protein